MYNCQCAFDPGCEVLDENIPFQRNVYPLIKEKKVNIYLQDFINTHHYSTLNDHHLLSTSSLIKRIIEKCQCAFEPDCEVLD